MYHSKKSSLLKVPLVKLELGVYTQILPFVLELSYNTINITQIDLYLNYYC